jgi:hypothetical protein
MKSYPNLLFSPSQWRQAPPSPFFDTESRDDSYPVSNSQQKFIREARKVDDLADPEEYYNEWIMSNVG